MDEIEINVEWDAHRQMFLVKLKHIAYQYHTYMEAYKTACLLTEVLKHLGLNARMFVSEACVPGDR